MRTIGTLKGRLTAAAVGLCALTTVCAAAAGKELELLPVEAGEWVAIAASDDPRQWVPQVERGPRVDGDLDDAVWAQAVEVPLTVRQALAAESEAWVKVRLLVDEKNLYVAARLAKPDGQLRAEVREPGGRVWLDDSLELFFMLWRSGASVQMDINANGAWWAGSHTAGKPWDPTPQIATKVYEDHWTLEMALPLADLQVQQPAQLPVSLEMRYLVKNQSGWVAWRGVSDPARFTRLTPSREHATGQHLQMTRYLLPARAAADRLTAAVEVHNPTDAARTATVRLIDGTRGATSLDTQRHKIEPGQRRVIRTGAALEPERGYRLILMAQDQELNQGWTFRRDQQVTTLPALALELDRSVVWAGDPELHASLDIGLNTAQRQEGQLTLLLARPFQQQLSIPVPMEHDQYRMRLPVGRLEPGKYELVARLSGAQEIVRRAELEVLPPPALPGRQQVPIQIDWAPGSGSDDVPVHVGVSLPGGLMRDVKNLRILRDGQAIPAEFAPLAAWSPGGSVRWLAARFLARPQASYSIEVGPDVTPAAAVEAVRVQETPEALLIDTGRARWEIPRQGPLLGRAWLGDKLVLQGGKPVLSIVDQQGQPADETRGGADEAPVIEHHGPLQVVVRREGFYRTVAGEPMAKYVVRMTFGAQQTTLPIQHTLVHTQSTQRIQYRDIAVTVQPAFGAPWDASFGWPQEAGVTKVNPAAGQAAAMAQLVYDHHGQDQRQAALLTRAAPDQPWTMTREGERAGNWGAAAGQGVGVGVSVRWFWQTFPKAVQVGPDGVSAHLWSSHGGRLLDLRTQTLADHYGRAWLDKKLHGGGTRTFLTYSSEGAGTGRTHDLAIHLFADDPARGDEIASAAALTDQPPLAVQDPAWLHTTLALGPLSPYDPQRFPRAENYIRNFFQMNLLGQVEHWGDYGFLDFGITPHTFNWGPQDPRKGEPLVYRYSNLAYGFESTVWMLLARSGARMYYDYAAAMNRARMDYAYVQHDLPGRPVGALLSSDTSVATPMAWSGAPSFYASQGTETDHFFYDYYLTGNRRGLDIAAMFKEHALARFDPQTLDRVSADTTVPYIMLLSLYQHDWDPRVGKLVRQCRERNVDARTDTGLADHDYYGAHYKLSTHLRGLVKDYQVTQDPQLLPALKKGLSYLLESPPHSAMGYQDHTGLYYTMGYQLFGDERFAAWGAERLAQLLGKNSDEEGNVVGWPYSGTHSPQGLETVAMGMELLRSAPESATRSAVPMLAAGERAFPISFHTIKQIREPLTFHVATSATPNIVLRTAYERPLSVTRPGSYFSGPLHLDLRLNYFGSNPPRLTNGYGQFRLPLEALAGEYELHEVSQVLWSDAPKLVLLAPQGLFLDGRRAPPLHWFITVPAGRAGAIYSSGAMSIHDGAQAAEGRQGAWHEISSQTSDRVIRLAPRELCFVRLRGDLPAVFAAQDPDRLFLPQGIELAAAPLPDLLDPQQAWVDGASGEPGDQAALLHPARKITAPIEVTEGQGKRAVIDPRAGTIEFWFNPQWTSPMQTENFTPLVFTAGGWTLQYLNHVAPANPYDAHHARRSTFDWTVPAAGGGQVKVQSHAPLEQGRWYHLALCWAQTADGWLCELYVDGRPSAHPAFKPLPADVDPEAAVTVAAPQPRFPLTFHGDFAAAVDSVRISSVPRYRQPFTPPPPPRMLDRHTTLLLPLDGNLQPLMAEAPVAAPVLNR